MRATPSESSRRTRGTYSLVRSRRRLSSSLLFSSQTTTTTKPSPMGKRPPPSEVPLLRCARALKHAQKHREREKKREKQRERRRSFVGLFSRASVSVCVCSFKGVQGVVQLSKRDVFPSRPGRYFRLPRLINQSVATKPNCNQHRAREEYTRDGKVTTTTIWWPRSGGEVLAEDVRIRKQRCASYIRSARIF